LRSTFEDSIATVFAQFETFAEPTHLLTMVKKKTLTLPTRRSRRITGEDPVARPIDDAGENGDDASFVIPEIVEKAGEEREYEEDASISSKNAKSSHEDNTDIDDGLYDEIDTDSATDSYDDSDDDSTESKRSSLFAAFSYNPAKKAYKSPQTTDETTTQDGTLSHEKEVLSLKNPPQDVNKGGQDAQEDDSGDASSKTSESSACQKLSTEDPSAQGDADRDVSSNGNESEKPMAEGATITNSADLSPGNLDLIAAAAAAALLQAKNAIDETVDLAELDKQRRLERLKAWNDAKKKAAAEGKSPFSDLKKYMEAINKKYDPIFQKAGASQTHGSLSLQQADDPRLKAIASLTTGVGTQPPSSRNPPHTKKGVIEQPYGSKHPSVGFTDPSIRLYDPTAQPNTGPIQEVTAPLAAAAAAAAAGITPNVASLPSNVELNTALTAGTPAGSSAPAPAGSALPPAPTATGCDSKKPRSRTPKRKAGSPAVSVNACKDDKTREKAQVVLHHTHSLQKMTAFEHKEQQQNNPSTTYVTVAWDEIKPMPHKYKEGMKSREEPSLNILVPERMDYNETIKYFEAVVKRLKDSAKKKKKNVIVSADPADIFKRMYGYDMRTFAVDDDDRPPRKKPKTRKNKTPAQSQNVKAEAKSTPNNTTATV
jgi:hypothetical protein